MLDYIKDRISVIVPVYNAEKSLTVCIESIQKQTYTNWELILIDDGSSDRSGIICDEFAGRDERIKVFHQENAGVSIARNQGIESSVGEYLVFIDSDDYITEQHLSNLYKAVQSAGSDLVVCDVFFSYKGKEWGNGWIQDRCTLGIHEYVQKIKDDFPNVCIGSSCNKLFYSKILKENNICFDCTIGYSEDYFFNIDYLRFCDLVSLIPEETLCYCLSDSDSLSKTYVSFADRLNLCEELYFKFCELGNGWKRGDKGYIRILTNCISEEVKNGGKTREIARYLKQVMKDSQKWGYVKNANQCREYPYCITGVLLKGKMFTLVAILFKIANFVRK